MRAQMAGTAVVKSMRRRKGLHYPVLVPNLKGLEILLDLLSEQPASEVLTLHGRDRRLHRRDGRVREG